MKIRLALALVIGFFLAACATSMSRSFDKLKMGMEKDQVLEEMGTPSKARRVNGIDRWTYVFYERQVRIEKEIQFEDGKVIYLGDPQRPVYSAEEMDEKHRKAEQSWSQQKNSKPTHRAEPARGAEGDDAIKKSPKFEDID